MQAVPQYLLARMRTLDIHSARLCKSLAFPDMVVDKHDVRTRPLAVIPLLIDGLA